MIGIDSETTYQAAQAMKEVMLYASRTGDMTPVLKVQEVLQAGEHTMNKLLCLYDDVHDGKFIGLRIEQGTVVQRYVRQDVHQHLDRFIQDVCSVPMTVLTMRVLSTAFPPAVQVEHELEEVMV